MWLIYLRVGRQEPDQQAEQAEDVLLELLDAVGTPAVDVPQSGVDHDQVGEGAELKRKRLTLFSYCGNKLNATD